MSRAGYSAADPLQRIIDAFEARYQRAPDIARAPGRVNLIGEHTDYNLGFVLPIAIDLACYAAGAPNREGLFRVHSENLNQSRQWPVDQVPSLLPSGDWSDYVLGVARQLPLGHGRDLLIHSTVPLGSGLSSSASLEVATALALGWPGDLPSLELAKIARHAETEFIGLPCGIMDQYVSVFGEENAALCIDCWSLTSESIQLPPNAAIIAVNTMVRHELGQSAYRQRVEECTRAAGELSVNSLRDATTGDLPRITDSTARKRAQHIISENQRVFDFIDGSRRDDLNQMGRLLIASHRSLQHDYEVSCAELDFLVDEAIKIPGVYGARMTGGGFGGCTVNLLDPSAAAHFETVLRTAYRAKFNLYPKFYAVTPSPGAVRLS